MNERIEYGLGSIYLFDVDSNGDNPSISGVAITGYDDENGIVTVDTDLTSIVEIGKYVIFHEENKNNYSWGLLTSPTTIELHQDAKDYFINTTITIKCYSGMGLANYEGLEVTSNETGLNYSGQYAFSRIFKSTDADITVNINQIIFDIKAVELLNNYRNESFGAGNVVTLGDYNVDQDKQVRPRDITLLILKRRVDNDDKYEELYIPRIKTSELNLPTERDGFMAQDYHFVVHTKSLSNTDVITYTCEV
jgi:hypothetical protein